MLFLTPKYSLVDKFYYDLAQSENWQALQEDKVNKQEPLVGLLFGLPYTVLEQDDKTNRYIISKSKSSITDI